jgi:uncharacterized protein (TIGR03086 family)
MDSAPLTVLSTGLDQLADLLLDVHADQLDRPSPCSDWTLGDLVDHVVASPAKFTAMARGEQPDWSAAPEHLDKGWAAAFRTSADELMEQLEGASGDTDPAWMTAEFAVHTWDLAHALGHDTSELDPAVAEQGLGFMQANLNAEMRGEAFRPEQPAPEDGDAYDAIAAFAGRTAAS